MTDLLQIDINADGRRAVAQIDAVDSALERLSARTTRDSAVIRNALNSIGDVNLRNRLLGGLEERLNQVTNNVNSNVNRINAGLNRVGAGGNQASLVGNAFGLIESRAAGAVPAISSLTAGLGGIGIAAVGIGAVAVGIGALGAKAIEATAQVEQWKANLETITGSSQKAEESYAALVKFAGSTPFDLQQSVEGFTKLKALGLKPTEEALRAFGNTAAAMGKPLSQMIEAVADASTGEFERLKEFGIKSKQEGDKVKFTFQGVTTTVAKNSNDIQKYLEGIGNNQFGGAMERQMDTIKGALSNVQDNIFQAFAAMGDGALGDTFKNMLKGIATAITDLTPVFEKMGEIIGGLLGALVDAGSAIFNVGNDALTGGQGVKAFVEVLDLLMGVGKFVADVIKAMWDMLKGVIGTVLQAVTAFSPLGAALQNTGKATGTLRDQFAQFMGSMAATAFRVIGAIASRFTYMKAVIGNVIAGINNAALDAGIGKFVGVTQRMATTDPAAEAKKVQDAYGKAAVAAEKIVVARYRSTQEDKKTVKAQLDTSQVAQSRDTSAADKKAADAKKKAEREAAAETKKAAKEQADALKKYEEAVKSLQDAKEDLGRTDEQIAILENLQKAGLPRTLDLLTSQNKKLREQATNIRNLTVEYRNMAAAKKIAETKEEDSIKDGNAYDTGAVDPQYQNAASARNAIIDERLRQRLENRKRFGLETGLTSLQQGILSDVPDNRTDNERESDKMADIEAGNAVRKKAAEIRLEGIQAETEAERELAAVKREGLQDPSDMDRLFKGDKSAEYQDEIASIQERLEKRREEIEKLKITAAAKERLLSLEQQIADAATQNAEQREQQGTEDLALEKAQGLYDIMSNLWENPKEAMKSFFADLLKKIAVAIIQSAILGKSLTNAGGGGIGGIFTKALTGALGFGGARETGGPVQAGKAYLVGEKRPELFVPGRAGTIIPKVPTGGASAGGTVFGETHININNTNGLNEEQVGLKVAQKQKMMIESIVDKKFKDKGIR